MVEAEHCGRVTSSKVKTTRSNTLMAYVTVEDSTGTMEMFCFARIAGDERQLPQGGADHLLLQAA